MPTLAELTAEAKRRGLFSPETLSLFEEADRRGLTGERTRLNEFAADHPETEFDFSSLDQPSVPAQVDRSLERPAAAAQPMLDVMRRAPILSPQQTAQADQSRQRYAESQRRLVEEFGTANPTASDVRMAGAREAMEDTPRFLRPVVKGLAGSAMSSLSALAAAPQLVGSDIGSELSAASNEFGGQLEQARRELNPGAIEGAITGTVESLTDMLTTGRLLPGGSMKGKGALARLNQGRGFILSAVAKEANSAAHQGREAGLQGAELAAFAGSKGMIEGGVTALFQMMGLGGVESAMLRETTKQTVGQALKQAGVTALAELPEETLITLMDSWTDYASGVNPQSLDKLPQGLAETTLATLMTAGVAEAPNVGRAVRDRSQRRAMNESLRGIGGDIETNLRRMTGMDDLAALKPQLAELSTAQDQQLAQATESLREAPAPAVDIPVRTAPTTPAPTAPTPAPAAPAPAPAAPTPAPAVPAPAPVSESPSQTSARKEWMTRDREALGLTELSAPARRSWETALTEAKDMGVPERASRLAQEVTDTPRSLNDTETAGVVIRASQLKNEHADVMGKLGQSKDVAETKTLAAEAARIEQDFDQLSRALRLSGTEKGRALAAQKLTIDRNYDLIAVLNRAKASKGEDLTAPERDKLKDLVKEHEEAERQVEEFEKEQDEETAEKTIRISRSKYENMVDFAKDKERGELLARLEADPKDAEALAQLAMNLGSRQGMGTLTAVADRITADTDGRINRHDVVAALLDAESKRKTQRSELMKTLAEIKKEAQADRRLRVEVEQLQKHLKEGTLPPPTKEGEEDPRTMIQVLKNFKSMLRDRLKNSPQVKRDRLERQIAKLEEQLKTGVVPSQLKEDAPLRDDFDQLTFERDRLRSRIRVMVAGHRPRTLWAKIAEPFNAARAVVASMDFSAVLRQGGFVTFAHPARAAKAIAPMLRSFGSEYAASKIDRELKTRPNALLYEKTGLYLAPLDSTSLTAMEETFMSRWAKKVPLVRNAERAYTTFLNKLRADSFDTMTASLTRNGEPTLAEAEAISNFINAATGRGKLGALESSSHVLNTLLFSPRYVASRFQLLSGQPLYGGTGRTRKMIAGEYAKYLLGIGTMYGLLAMLGGGDEEDDVQITFDPRTADFGKIKIGNTRVDPLSGLGQVVVLGGRLATGETKSSTTGEVSPIRGEVEFGRQTSVGVVGRFIRSKLSPMTGTIVDVASGTDVIGKPVTAGSVAKNLTIPISFRDIQAAIEEQGADKGTALGLVSLFGAGVQTYAAKADEDEDEGED